MQLYSTSHFKQRIKQRGFKNEIIIALYEYGEFSDVIGGCYKLYFSKKSLFEIKRKNCGLYKMAEKHRNKYIVISEDGYCITAAIKH